MLTPCSDQTWCVKFTATSIVFVYTEEHIWYDRLLLLLTATTAIKKHFISSSSSNNNNNNNEDRILHENKGD